MIRFDVSVLGASGQEAELLKRDALYAGGLWARYLTGDTTLQVQIEVADIDSLAWGSSALAGVTGMAGGLAAYQQGAVLKLMDEPDLNGAQPDILIRIDREQLDALMWLDPAPGAGILPGIPFGTIDAVSVLAHEFGHAFSFNGWTDQKTGTVETRALPYDRWVTMRDGAPYFSGPVAMAAYGAEVPLTPGNLLHYGTSWGSGSELRYGLMAGTGSPPNHRADVSDLDLAFLADSGVPLNVTFGSAGNDALAGASIAGLAGADSITGTGGADQALGGRGDDMLLGLDGTDSLRGDEGADTLFGNKGYDTLVAGDGADLLFGGRGYDVLLGGAGADTLWGDRGHDTLVGGADNDVFAFGWDSGFDVIDKFELGDRIRLPTGADYQVSYLGDSTQISFGASSVTLTETNTFRLDWIVYT